MCVCVCVPWCNIILCQKVIFQGAGVEYYANFNFEVQVRTQDWFDTHMSLNEEEMS